MGYLGLSIGVIVFIQYNLYFSIPYPINLPITEIFLHDLDFQKTFFDY